MTGPSSNQAHSLYIQGPNITVTPDSNGQPTSVSKTATWTNALGHPIYVYRGYPFVGEGMGGLSDTALQLGNQTSGDTYVIRNWDHYAPPSGINDTIPEFDASPGWFVVSPGDIIALTLTCTGPYGGTPSTMVGCIALLYYFV